MCGDLLLNNFAKQVISKIQFNYNSKIFSSRRILTSHMSRQQRSILSFFGKKDSPRPTKRAKKTDKENENTSLKDAIVPFENVGKGWSEHVGKEFSKDYFKELETFLKSEYKSRTVFPPKKDVFSAFKMDLDKVRVVVIGQDPYHGTWCLSSCKARQYKLPCFLIVSSTRMSILSLHIICITPLFQSHFHPLCCEFLFINHY